ncbi:hypothetical protein MHYP_G00008110 [Metynnis hypsauchen]
MWLLISLISLYGVFIFVAKAAEIQSLRQTISADLGASVSLQCSAPEQMSLLYWYKQSIGKKLQLLVTVPKYGFVEFYGEFKDNPRFMVARNSGIANLSISNTISSDTAVYYCAQFNAGIMSFGEGILLILQDAEYGHHTILQKPMSYQGHQGDSILFGNGSNLKVEERCEENHLIVYSLVATLALFLILIVVFLVIPINKRKSICCQKCRELSHLPNNDPSIPRVDVQEEHEEDTPNYAALNLGKKKAKSRRERKPEETVVVYSLVRCKNGQTT